MHAGPGRFRARGQSDGSAPATIASMVSCWWTLDAFDFTIFVFIMRPISQAYGVPLTAVTAVFTLTLWYASPPPESGAHSGQERRDRGGDSLAGRTFVEGESGRRIDLEANPASIRRPAQIRAGQSEAETLA